MAEGRELEVRYYKTPRGASPFKRWRDGITDVRSRQAIDARIARVRTGNLSKSKPVGEGVSESKIDFGPGFRIYYGTDGDLVILLSGGDKSTQSRADIAQAKAFWKDYKDRK